MCIGPNTILRHDASYTPFNGSKMKVTLKLTKHFTYLRLVFHFILLVKELTDSSFHSLRDLIHILRLDQSLQVILKDLGKVVLQFRPAEVRQNLLPVWGVLL